METASGFLLIDKQKGWTSHDVVAKMRGITGIKKIGHAGTLDPAATGLLILGLGRATKELASIIGLDKEYEAKIELGTTTDTYDSEGKILAESDVSSVDEEKIKEVLAGFVGPQDQTPPMYSAKKVNGQKLYELARKGVEIKREPHQIEIYEIELLDSKLPCVDIRVKCSSGTYIRSLAYDLGQRLGVGAYLKELQRTQIGDISLKEALQIDELNKDNWSTYLTPGLAIKE